MNKTANFQLTQWEKTDRIMMEDFNRDNEKIDTALKSSADGVAALQTAMAGAGNCKIVYGSYTGTGKYGSGQPNTLNFAHKPVFVCVQQKTNPNTSTEYALRMIRDSVWANGTEDNYTYSQIVTWGANSVSWYSVDPNFAAQQFNESGKIYQYIALLEAGA